MKRSAEEITVRLDGTWKNGKGKANCPAHDDKTPSLSIEDKDGKLLYHCHTGCSQEDLTHTLKQRGLLGDSAPPSSAPAPRKPKPEAEGEALTDRPLTGSQLAIPPEFYRQPHHDFMQRREQFFPTWMQTARYGPQSGALTHQGSRRKSSDNHAAGRATSAVSVAGSIGTGRAERGHHGR